MKRFLLLSAMAIALVTIGLGHAAQAGGPHGQNCGPNGCGYGHGGYVHGGYGHSNAKGQYWAAMRGRSLPWHNAYYHEQFGQPVALVVPPTAEFQSHYGWGVGGMRVTPIYHQFGRAYPGPGGGGSAYGGFYPDPNWPSDTNQFGVYYVRGPW